MTMRTKIKTWLGLAAKPEQPEPIPEDDRKTIDLPNGRRAVVDERGNFVKFEE